MPRFSILTGGEAGPIVRGTPAELEADYARRKRQSDAVQDMIGTLDRIFEERGKARQREALLGPPQPTTPSPEELRAEREHLRGMMGNPASEYWKGPEAERLQARYRELSAGEEG